MQHLTNYDKINVSSPNDRVFGANDYGNWVGGSFLTELDSF